MSFNTRTETSPRCWASAFCESAAMGVQRGQSRLESGIFSRLTRWLNASSDNEAELERLTLIAEQRPTRKTDTSAEIVNAA